jgi:hypothetical protein
MHEGPPTVMAESPVGQAWQATARQMPARAFSSASCSVREARRRGNGPTHTTPVTLSGRAFWSFSKRDGGVVRGAGGRTQTAPELAPEPAT